MSCLLTYWRLVVPTKSVAELDAELWLFLVALPRERFVTLPCLHFNRWHLVVVTFLNLFCIGSIFSADFLDDSIDQYFLGQSQNRAMRSQLVGMLALGLTAALGGPFVESRGPRMGMTVGTGLVVCGWIFAHIGVMTKVYQLLNLGFGVFVGAGYGITLITSISTLQKWFPDLRGVVTGICIAGMGVGTMLWIKIYSILLHRQSDHIFQRVSQELENDGLHLIFIVHLISALFVMLLATMVLRTPPPNYTVNGSDIHCVPANKAPAPSHVQSDYLNVGMTLVNYAAVRNDTSTTDDVYYAHVKALSLVQCILSSDFFFLYVAFAASVAPIVLFSFEISDIVEELLNQTQDEASSLLTYISIADCLGNFFGPVLADVVIRVFYANPAYVRKMAFVVLLLTQCIGMSVFISTIDNVDCFQWPLYVTTFACSGGFGLIPSLLADLFGVYNAGTIYGLILTTWSIGSMVVGLKLRQMGDTKSHHVTEQSKVLLVFAIVGCVVMVLVRSSSMDRFYRGYQLTICGKILVQRPSRHLMLEQANHRSLKSTQRGGTDVFYEWTSDQRTHGHDRLSDSVDTSPILLVDPAYPHQYKF
ncbi:hypothetical protein LEN26_001711 [Aphanomyces euteiches]|nr:hypothetical protein AeMF1_015338 [Aphanomyces euteiches]KAH9160786.1 hypothetical protein LEN26_001711 [Aphanomyces euteiches]KAH9185478.1 hypothetical protein AeNC1_012548 [Aphanomyces euteiches]